MSLCISPALPLRSRASRTCKGASERCPRLSYELLAQRHLRQGQLAIRGRGRHENRASYGTLFWTPRPEKTAREKGGGAGVGVRPLRSSIRAPMAPAIPPIYVHSRRSPQPRDLRKLASDIPGLMERRRILLGEDVMLPGLCAQCSGKQSSGKLGGPRSQGERMHKPRRCESGACKPDQRCMWADVERWLIERCFEHSVEHWLPLQQLWKEAAGSWPRNLRSAHASDRSLHVPGPQPRQGSAEEWRFYPLDVAPPGTRGRRHKSVPDWTTGWELHFHGDHIYHVSCYMACGEVLPEESDSPSRAWRAWRSDDASWAHPNPANERTARVRLASVGS